MAPEPLSESGAEHLIAALDDEHQARATYAQVIADFGDVYENLREASQERHLPAFRRCAEREGAEPDGAAPDDGASDDGGGRRRRRRGG